jgi:putative NADPH-quinone reductase
MSDVLILDGHPRKGSFGDAVCERYAAGAKAAGHTVELVALRDLSFDPVLHLGYAGEQEMEPDLARMQEAIKACKRLVLVYPIWWGGMPAQMKGFVDRVFLPGFAFKYHKGGSFWDKLLAGRSGRIIVTMDAPPWYDWLMYRAAGTHVAKMAILGFVGFKPVRTWRVGSVRHSSEAQRNKWLQRAENMGRQD